MNCCCLIVILMLSIIIMLIVLALLMAFESSNMNVYNKLRIKYIFLNSMMFMSFIWITFGFIEIIRIFVN